ncbi:hypothetical protein FOVG_02164 [Fusarium oxysporum f. sp. pisi HDV247]|uniref:O-methyltransferase n=1 Tax=Fusarium oxysporum f. sp. pisi HDV247 TaxID=1080344 RepID=W9QI57_FUSOX|nr:hypothetical protein FOVG_02164 [Fusarium oxysporum f. sp. pisi HDV247]
MPDIDFSALAAAADFDNFRQAPILDTLANSALLSSNPKLEQALANSAAKGLPPISVTPMSGQHLTILTQLMGAKSVLEIGTLGGYSAICFAQGGAKVTSIEIDPKHRDVALENVEGLDVEVLLGTALDVLTKMTMKLAATSTMVDVAIYTLTAPLKFCLLFGICNNALMLDVTF